VCADEDRLPVTVERLGGVPEIVGLPDQSHCDGQLEAGPGPIRR
jgi:hypothetical protein